MKTSLRSYVGFDRHPGMIQWCQTNLASQDARFTFDYFNLQSTYMAWDQHAGNLAVSDFTFPYVAGQFSAVLLASVFTHMPIGEIRHYLHELTRTVHPGGKILLSVFFAAGEPYVLTEGVNVFHRPQEFFAAVTSAGLQWRALAGDTPPGVGFTHNWYILEHASVA